ncbi:hypothetical protein HK099_001432 [Clydaea vesicula]|uniref:Methyltransferase domain-containing protein n=1 Tax=Clydaea vesicula TaxID=447962 RepID=A0AAD5U7L6_9FUNG|nr:hypothetical protein HK099_001432 [Clydaea vesicula]
MKLEDQEQWNIERVKSLYREMSKNYDDDVSIESYPSPYIIGSWIIKELKNCTFDTKKKVVKILDVGCGTGVSSTPFFSSEDFLFEVTGIDATEEMLEIAKNKPFKMLKQVDLNTDFFEDQVEIFDAAVCVGVLDFIQNLPKLFFKINKLLKKGKDKKPLFGLTSPILLNENNIKFMKNFTDCKKKEENVACDDTVFNYFKQYEKNLTNLFIKTNFKLLKVDLIFGYKDSVSLRNIFYWGLLLEAN